MPEIPLPTKLGIREGMTVALLHAPGGIETTLGDLPAGVEVVKRLRKSDRVDMILAFVTDRDHLASNLGWLLQTLPSNGAFWVAWPKKASGVPTDMTDHSVRDIALPLGWVDTKVCAIDATWTGLKLVLRKELR